MAGTSLNLMNLKSPKPPAPPATSPMPKLGKTTSGFPAMGQKSATPTVKKPAVKAVAKGKATKSAPSLVNTGAGSGLAGALAAKNLV